MDGDFVAVVRLRAFLVHESGVAMEQVFRLGWVALGGWSDLEGIDGGGMMVVVAFY